MPTNARQNETDVVTLRPLPGVNGVRSDVRYRGQSGHGLFQCTCPLMTQCGHQDYLVVCRRNRVGNPTFRETFCVKLIYVNMSATRRFSKRSAQPFVRS